MVKSVKLTVTMAVKKRLTQIEYVTSLYFFLTNFNFIVPFDFFVHINKPV